MTGAYILTLVLRWMPESLEQSPTVSVYWGDFVASGAHCHPLFFSPLLLLPRLDYGNAAIAGITSLQLRRLQSVMNAAVRPRHTSTASSTLTLRSIARSVQAGGVGLPVFTFHMDLLHPINMADVLHPITDPPGRCRLRSALTSVVAVPLIRLTSVLLVIVLFRQLYHGHGSWNSLPPDVTSSRTLY